MTNVQRALTNPVGSVSPTSRYLFGIKLALLALLALLARLRDGESIVLHCKGGLGRTGMVAARLLVELGCMPEEAIVAVRQARSGTIETPNSLKKLFKLSQFGNSLWKLLLLQN